MIENFARKFAPRLSDTLLSPAANCGYLRCRERAPRWRGAAAAGLRANGDWFCSPACLEHRILRDCSGKVIQPPITGRMPLGMILLARGVISERDLRCGLELQQASRKRIGECLQGLGKASAQQVTAALAVQWQCAAMHEAREVAPQAAAVPITLLREGRMVPVRATHSVRLLYVAFDGPVDHGALYALARMLECRTEPCITEPAILNEMLSRAAEQVRDVEVDFGDTTPEMMARTAANYAEELSGGEVRYVSWGRFFWMRIPRARGMVQVVFSGSAMRSNT